MTHWEQLYSRYDDLITLQHERSLTMASVLWHAIFARPVLMHGLADIFNSVAFHMNCAVVHILAHCMLQVISPLQCKTHYMSTNSTC